MPKSCDVVDHVVRGNTEDGSFRLLFSTRETPNSSERLKTKVASHEVHRAITKTMDNCVRVLDTLQGFGDEASSWQKK